MPVDSYPEGASYYGAYNMAGNVFEWVSDWYDPRYYGRLETMVNPTGPAKPIWMGGTGTYVDRLTVGEKRVIRGGSWIAPEGTVRATHRFWNHPLNNSYGVGWASAAPRPPRRKSNSRSEIPTSRPLWKWDESGFRRAQQAWPGAWPLIPRIWNLLELAH